MTKSLIGFYGQKKWRGLVNCSVLPLEVMFQQAYSLYAPGWIVHKRGSRSSDDAHQGNPPKHHWELDH